MPVKKSDARAQSFIAVYGDKVVELDALDPNVLQHFVAEAIEDYIDKGAWIVRLKEIKGLKRWIKSKLRDIEGMILAWESP